MKPLLIWAVRHPVQAVIGALILAAWIYGIAQEL